MRRCSYDRPVWTYDEALGWLFGHSHVHEWFDDPEDIPREAALICDIYWVTPERLCRDLKRHWNSCLSSPRMTRREIDRAYSRGRL